MHYKNSALFAIAMFDITIDTIAIQMNYIILEIYLSRGVIKLKTAYDKPKCDCGCELYFTGEYCYEARSKITKNGQVSKRHFWKGTPGGHDNTYWALVCPICGNDYEIITGEKNRIYRGDRIQ